VDAAGHLLLFLVEPLSLQVYGFRKGSAVWAYLDEQHNVWLQSRGMVSEDEKRRLRPCGSESEATYCQRAVQLQSHVPNVHVSMAVNMLDGLERGRPEWTMLLQALQGSLSSRVIVQDVQPDLVRLQVKVKKSMDVKAACSAMVGPQLPSTPPISPSTQQALEPE
jgi:hypothetical protein